jgi:uncharacterized SAM-binding protein YcdF (DUF218 family)
MPASLLEWLIFPPGGVVLLALLGLLLWPRRSALALTATAVAALWLASTPAVSFLLVDRLQSRHPPLDTAALPGNAQAIVVLAAGRRNATPDFGDTVSRLTLARVRYAAHLHRLTDLPVVPTGGAPGRAGGEPAGKLGREILQREFKVAAPLSEEASASTYENALYTRQLLAEHGIERILLVTQAMHMPRAVASFEAVGFTVVPAPTDYVMRQRGIYRWLPDARTLGETTLALHETLGGRWYRLRYESSME